VGTNLREALAADQRWTVFGLDRRAPREEFSEQYLERCDLLDYANLESIMRYIRPDHVVHLAAQSRVEPSIRDPIETYRLNVEATLNVMRACTAAKAGHRGASQLL